MATAYDSPIPVLTFRMLKNVTIDLGNDIQYQPKMTIVEDPTIVSYGVVQKAEFDLTVIHEAPLVDETPRLPRRRPLETEIAFNKRCDQAYAVVEEAQKANAALRKRVGTYVRAGILELVNDPFSDTAEYEEPEAPVVKPRTVSQGRAASDAPAPKRKTAAKKPVKKKITKRTPAARKPAAAPAAAE